MYPGITKENCQDFGSKIQYKIVETGNLDTLFINDYSLSSLQ
jgi:hypothetical protein